MKIEFRFNNGSSTLILLPESQREKTQIAMFGEGKDIRIAPSGIASPESLVLTTEIAKASPAANANVPVEDVQAPTNWLKDVKAR